MKVRFIIPILLVIVLSHAASDSSFSETEGAGVTFRWKITADRLEIQLEAETEGWIAVGFEPSQFMKDANILIGYVQDGEATVSDQFGTGVVSHRKDLELGGNNDVEILGGSEENGVTMIHFSIPLDSGDAYDQVLSPGSEHTIILAYGSRDNLRIKHSSKTTTQFRLSN